MGLLDAVLENPEMLGDVARFATDNPEIANAAMKFLGAGNGSGSGLANLVETLQSGGLGDAVASWLVSGDNQAIAPEQLQSALGDSKISEFAEQAGVSGSEAGTLLASILPQVVDKLSPDGQLPDAGGLDSMLGGLLGSLSQ